MKIQITFKNSETQYIEMGNNLMPTPIFGAGDTAYLSVISKEGDTFIYNWDVIKHVRSFFSETDEAKQDKLPGVDS